MTILSVFLVYYFFNQKAAFACFINGLTTIKPVIKTFDKFNDYLLEKYIEQHMVHYFFLKLGLNLHRLQTVPQIVLKTCMQN